MSGEHTGRWRFRISRLTTYGRSRSNVDTFIKCGSRSNRDSRRNRRAWRKELEHFMELIKPVSVFWRINASAVDRSSCIEFDSEARPWGSVRSAVRNVRSCAAKSTGTRPRSIWHRVETHRLTGSGSFNEGFTQIIFPRASWSFWRSARWPN